VCPDSESEREKNKRVGSVPGGQKEENIQKLRGGKKRHPQKRLCVKKKTTPCRRDVKDLKEREKDKTIPLMATVNVVERELHSDPGQKETRFIPQAQKSVEGN